MIKLAIFHITAHNWSPGPRGTFLKRAKTTQSPAILTSKRASERESQQTENSVCERERESKMADEQPSITGRRRTRGTGAAVRSEALERLKALRSGGRRSEAGAFQIKMDAPIYDTVEEDEYDALVAKRREEARGFIVDDDGLGYGDEGEEEDWSKAGMPPSSDESEGDSEKPKRKRVDKKDPPPKRPNAASASLSAAAAMMGKQRLSSMFTSSVFKTTKDDKGKGFSCDSIVDDLLAEFAPDESDRERRRRGPVGLPSKASSKSFIPAASINNDRESFRAANISSCSKLALENGNSDLTKSVELSDYAWSCGRDCEEVAKKGSVVKTESGKDLDDRMGQNPPVKSSDSCNEISVVVEKKVDVLEAKIEPVMKKEEGFTLNAKINEEKDPALSATAGWQAVRGGGAEDVGGAIVVNNCLNNEESLDFDLDSDGSLPFYILDAHEEFYGANMGTVYLFGKVNLIIVTRCCYQGVIDRVT